MADTIKVKARLDGDVAEVRSLIRHPMDTGLRKDPETGELIPRHHITQLRFTNNGKTVLVANLSTAVSRNPYFAFSFAGAKTGDRLEVSWVDNLGATDQLETVL